LLGGSAELNDPLIRNHNWTMVLKRPVSLGAIADLIQKTLPLPPPVITGASENNAR
jgi:hypothetical protein